MLLSAQLLASRMKEFIAVAEEENKDSIFDNTYYSTSVYFCWYGYGSRD